MTAAAALGLSRPTRTRIELTEQVFELRPIMKRLFGAGVYRELRDELQASTNQRSTGN